MMPVVRGFVSDQISVWIRRAMVGPKLYGFFMSIAGGVREQVLDLGGHPGHPS